MLIFRFQKLQKDPKDTPAPVKIETKEEIRERKV